MINYILVAILSVIVGYLIGKRQKRDSASVNTALTNAWTQAQVITIEDPVDQLEAILKKENDEI